MRYENPLYLAEEVAALDLLTDQRIAIGISRGSPEQALRGWETFGYTGGVDPRGADVAFTGHDLGLIPQALRHARRGGKIINQNIVLSLAIITVLLPLAITGVLGLAAVVLVHEVAEVVVIANGLRAARARKQ